MLDFRIQTFLAVCRTMNFTEAAKQLHITQPAVSQHIHALEKTYGTELFQYHGKKMELTESGRLLLQAANAMNHDIRHLQEQIRQIAACRTLHFGATLTIGEYIMPEALTRLIRREPDIRLRMLIGNTEELLKLMNNGEIDFAVIEGFFQNNMYDSIVWKKERFLPVCSPEYRFCREVSCLKDLLEERLLVRESGSGTREVLERALKEHNILLEDFGRLTELGNLNVIKSLVSDGTGISFFYESVVKKELEAGHLREIELTDFTLSHEFSFLWQKGSIFTPYYQEVFRLLHGDETDV